MPGIMGNGGSLLRINPNRINPAYFSYPNTPSGQTKKTAASKDLSMRQSSYQFPYAFAHAAIPAMSCGDVRQHPPMSRAPAARQRRAPAAKSSALPCHVLSDAS